MVISGRVCGSLWVLFFLFFVVLWSFTISPTFIVMQFFWMVRKKKFHSPAMYKKSPPTCSHYGKFDTLAIGGDFPFAIVCCFSLYDARDVWFIELPFK